jgi:hypothetical protein
MSTYHFHHQFHAVGHGTFFTGLIVGTHDEPFRWLYDCGSKSTNRIRDGIERLPSESLWQRGTTIDLMIVSHFDNDHVNGLEQFLESYRAKWLVLPYVGLKQRLAHAASLGDEEVSSAATAGFAIDSLGWLAARGLSERVDGVLLVQGGEGDGALDGGDPLPGTPPLGSEQAVLADIGWRAAEALGQYRSAADSAKARPELHLRSHRLPVSAGLGLPMEFVFFNTALPMGIANRSKQDIGVVAQEVAAILDRFAVLATSGPRRRGWRSELRACYDRHFGRSGTERNNISLCTLARPLVGARQCDCKIINQQAWCGRGGHTLTDLPDQEQALLLTGDLTLASTPYQTCARTFVTGGGINYASCRFRTTDLDIRGTQVMPPRFPLLCSCIACRRTPADFPAHILSCKPICRVPESSALTTTSQLYRRTTSTTDAQFRRGF